MSFVVERAGHLSESSGGIESDEARVHVHLVRTAISLQGGSAHRYIITPDQTSGIRGRIKTGKSISGLREGEGLAAMVLGYRTRSCVASLYDSTVTSHRSPVTGILVPERGLEPPLPCEN